MRLPEYALFAFGSLFVIVDPIAAVPAFLAMTARESVEQRLRTARVACLVSVGLLTGFAFLGQSLFSILGITMPAFQVAAGLVLLLVAFDMVRAQRSAVQETAEETAAGAVKDDVAITPLAMPMLAGPGALSTVILLNAQAQNWAQRAVLVGCLIAVGAASYVTLALAGRGAHWLSPIAEKIITRLMGLLLSAVAVQFIFNAVKAEGGLLGR
ncbi:MAG TPA: MarC family protein [Nitrospiraceae bacterium]|nr:MarC family protein [Nitrospiraceae bacterium]